MFSWKCVNKTHFWLDLLPYTEVCLKHCILGDLRLRKTLYMWLGQDLNQFAHSWRHSRMTIASVSSLGKLGGHEDVCTSKQVVLGLNPARAVYGVFFPTDTWNALNIYILRCRAKYLSYCLSPDARISKLKHIFFNGHKLANDLVEAW